jgi:hypothetical protein
MTDFPITTESLSTFIVRESFCKAWLLQAGNDIIMAKASAVKGIDKNFMFGL